VQKKNKMEKRKEKHNMKNKNIDKINDHDIKEKHINTDISSLGNNEDDQAIQNILNYLDDPELKDKFIADKNSIQTMEVDINN